MTDNKHSPFATGLLQASPTQAHIADAKKQFEKQQKQQQARQTKQQKQQQTEQQIARGTKPFWWLMTMFICALVYLIPEVVFNAALTEVAGGRHSSEDDLRAVELFGRTISGVGVTLLLADLLITGRRLASVGRALAYFGLLAVIVWPSVFFGQKWLVDNFIIDAWRCFLNH
ncbi:hypothetical protein [Shewanella sp. NIFS-20-20]|uniref:hypothetical protein n=1 Tax=Shewanella sp. NIFS-20-20 TaxID=2853806 RepID=UPI001C461163|nr:hypothetical protein [Shewanella sp. NIFS-20-20]MBV7316557.1 hypothetical protein [Shewanella sp. NIFS-20-20]